MNHFWNDLDELHNLRRDTPIYIYTYINIHTELHDYIYILHVMCVCACNYVCQNNVFSFWQMTFITGNPLKEKDVNPKLLSCLLVDPTNDFFPSFSQSCHFKTASTRSEHRLGCICRHNTREKKKKEMVKLTHCRFFENDVPAPVCDGNSQDHEQKVYLHLN